MVKKVIKKGKRAHNERLETLMRVVVGIVSGIILYLWGYAVAVVAGINFLYTLIIGKRLKEVADFTEIWTTQSYHFMRYMGFVTNERPFPFVELKKNLGKFE